MWIHSWEWLELVASFHVKRWCPSLLCSTSCNCSRELCTWVWYTSHTQGHTARKVRGYGIRRIRKVRRPEKSERERTEKTADRKCRTEKTAKVEFRTNAGRQNNTMCRTSADRNHNLKCDNGRRRTLRPPSSVITAKCKGKKVNADVAWLTADA